MSTKFLLLVFILPVILPGRELTSISEIIAQCKNETAEFIKTEEKKYAEEAPQSFLALPVPGNNISIANFVGFPLWPIMHKRYRAECRQRVVECISNKTEEEKHTKKELRENKDYQNIVRKCRQRKQNITCDPKALYRTIDGTCNNPVHKRWGSTFNCFSRLLPANYDGVSGIRKSVCNKALPEPRNISVIIHQQADRLNRNFSLMFVFTGQLWAHDITDIPPTAIGNKTINCCSVKGQGHPQCAPIAVQSNDRFYNQFQVKCLNFIRASLCETCKAGKRNQMSQVTAYLDASVVYGSDAATEKGVRGEKGRLNETGQNVMPPDETPLNGSCGNPTKKEFCFRGGDRRCNQHVVVMTLQTMCMREHNRIVEVLLKLNPHWSHEKCYQEARKILIALIQIVVYKEYLPLLLGKSLMAKYNLAILKQGWTTYNSSLNPTMMVEFNTAGYRLHSLVFRNVLEENGETKLLRDLFGNPTLVYDGKSDTVVNGVCQKPIQRYDRYIEEDLTDYMYRLPPFPGTDIASLNIQRGRDLGLPTYVAVVNHFIAQGHERYRNMKKFETFNDLKQLMSEKNVALLEKMYCDVRDVDLWVAIQLEVVDKDKVTGPTAGLIIAIQFWLLKFGDRFYCEHKGQFTQEQLKVLRQNTMSKMLCRNINITDIPVNSMKLGGSGNPNVKCSAIRGMDLSPWKEEQGGNEEEGEKKESEGNEDGENEGKGEH